MTYVQPPESLGPVTSVPYTAVVPSSSNCVTYTSAALYTALPKSINPVATASGNSAPAVGVNPGFASAPVATSSSAATVMGTSATAGGLGVLFALAFLS